MTNQSERTLVGLVSRLVSGYMGNVRHGRGLCSTCGQAIEPRYTQCYRCHQATVGAAAVGSPRLADQVAILAYGGGTLQSSQLLHGYKEPIATTAGDDRRTVVLLLLRAAFHFHRLCLERGDPFRYFSVVPSTKSRPDHPLGDLVRSWLTAAGLREMSLRATDNAAGRVVDLAKFDAPRIEGGHVLLIDDTWTTGSNVQSAAWSLRPPGRMRSPRSSLPDGLTVGPSMCSF